MKNKRSAASFPTAEAYLAATLLRVDSKMVREWASSAHNRPIWLKVAQATLDRGDADTCRFAAYIVCVAIGA
jgi:hypothetical protein